MRCVACDPKLWLKLLKNTVLAKLLKKKTLFLLKKSLINQIGLNANEETTVLMKTTLNC